MAGLPFTQLPANQVTPEQDIQREIQTGRKNIQDKFNLQWNTINSNARTLGPQRHKAMLAQLRASGEQEMLEFNQQAQQQLDRFKTVDRIAASGGMAPERQAELKDTMAYGRDVAEAMHPTEAREKTVPEQLGILDAYSRLISNEKNKNFREYTPEDKRPSKFNYLYNPLLGAIQDVRHKMAKKPGITIQVLDPSIPAKDAKGKPVLDKYGDPIMGYYRKATEEEKQRYKNLLQEEKDIQKEKDRLVAMPDVFARKPGTKGGTFGDKIAASYDKPEVKQQTNNDPLGLFQ